MRPSEDHFVRPATWHHREEKIPATLYQTSDHHAQTCWLSLTETRVQKLAGPFAYVDEKMRPNVFAATFFTKMRPRHLSLQCCSCFRGWWVLLGCILIRLASAPGHSFGVVAFVDSFIESLSTDRLSISFAWLAASCTSTVLTPFAGAALDQLGVRLFGCAVAPLLFLSMCGLSSVTNTTQLALALSMVRFVGPECLSLASGVTYQRWFDRRRGRAAAVFGVSGIVLISLPALFSALIEAMTWRPACQFLAVLLVGLLLLGTAMAHDTPQQVGLLPDGDRPSSSHDLKWCDDDEAAAAAAAAARTAEREPRTLKVADASETTTVATSSTSCTTTTTTTSQRGSTETARCRPRVNGAPMAVAEPPPLPASTLRAAARQPLLWCLALTDTCFSLFWAGFNLTALDVVASRSNDLRELGAPQIARDLFLPMSVCQNGCKMLLSLLVIDRLSHRARALATAGSGVAVAGVAVLSLALRAEAHVVTWSVAYGLSTGVYMAFTEVIHASLFGTAALGRILGLQRAFATFSTGVGPILFASSVERLGGAYDPAILLAAGSLVVTSLLTLLLASVTLRRGRGAPSPRVHCERKTMRDEAEQGGAGLSSLVRAAPDS